jgi:thiol:disulfide interchange protein DsbA
MSFKSLLTAVASLAFAAAASAQAPFATLSPPQPTEGGGKIEVIEFFWYGCPHCYTLEPSVEGWLRNVPKDVAFKRVPAVPSEGWGEMAKVFYTLETMGVLDQYHAKVFDAMHKQRLNLANAKVREKWLADNGIDAAKYASVEKSFTVATKVNRAKQLTYAYKVDSVPRVVVDGRYYTSAEQAGGADRIFPIVDQLVARARQEKGAAARAPAAAATK